MLTKVQYDSFWHSGFLKFKSFLNSEEVKYYSSIYNSILDETINSSQLRSDLSGEKSASGEEKITQIMLPSRLRPEIAMGVLHSRSIRIAKELFGRDMSTDFDMLISKAPFSSSATPWHQDEAYWISLPDKSALSIWTSIDKAEKENGCMWYIPQSHKAPLRKHTQSIEGGALSCKGSEEEAIAIPLESGDCVMHHGRTVHYSRGNSTKTNRRAFIINLRPPRMIELERKQGYDHSGKRKIREQSYNV